MRARLAPSPGGGPSRPVLQGIPSMLPCASTCSRPLSDFSCYPAPVCPRSTIAPQFGHLTLHLPVTQLA